MPSVRSNGFEMYYEEHGQGFPLILLMGLGADGPTWKEHVNAYQSHFRCITIDNRGAGRSDKPKGPYSTKMMAEDTLEIMDALNIHTAHISGISMGSAIAQELALKNPDRIQSITLNCPWSQVDAYAKRIFQTLKSSVGALDQTAFIRMLQLIIFTPDYHKNNISDLLEREQVAKEHAYPMPVHAFQAQCDACIAHHTAGQLYRIKAPTLITVGDQDIFTPLKFAQSIAEEIGHAQMEVFEGSGHTHHWDSIQTFNRLTLDFMLEHS